MSTVTESLPVEDVAEQPGADPGGGPGGPGPPLSESLGIDFYSGYRKKNPGIHFYSGYRGNAQVGIDLYSGFRKKSRYILL